MPTFDHRGLAEPPPAAPGQAARAQASAARRAGGPRSLRPGRRPASPVPGGRASLPPPLPPPPPPHPLSTLSLSLAVPLFPPIPLSVSPLFLSLPPSPSLPVTLLPLQSFPLLPTSLDLSAPLPLCFPASHVLFCFGKLALALPRCSLGCSFASRIPLTNFIVFRPPCRCRSSPDGREDMPVEMPSKPSGEGP